eukprot:Rhum_TRINITY_DN15209_c0_g1::Rhum_TRINITY_DN15209_c0_g1_i1::g.144030::m.144030
MAAQQRDGYVRAGSLIWALRRAWDLPPELCEVTVLFWESYHVEHFRRCIMKELEVLCIRMALQVSCLLRKNAAVAPVGPFSRNPRVWKAWVDRLQLQLFNLPPSDLVMALEARVRKLPFLERYDAPACHPNSSIRQGKCGTCGSIDVESWLDDWAKF